MMSATSMKVTHEAWPLRDVFAISRGKKKQADVVVVALQIDGTVGRGECVPYARYGESVSSVIAQIHGLSQAIADGLTQKELAQVLPPGAARNALDCAFWDLRCKQTHRAIWQHLKLPVPQPILTAYTLSLDTPENMRAKARQNAHRPLLKLKLADGQDVARVAAVREGAPSSTLIVDANESWNPALYESMIEAFVTLGVAMIEQPLPAHADDALTTLPRPIPICADESCHDRHSLPKLAGRYDVINIKLDKTGGLSEALQLRELAQQQGFQVMVGSMVATSLSMAPALLVAQGTAYADLDSPLLLQRDRAHGLTVDGSFLAPSTTGLWG